MPINLNPGIKVNDYDYYEDHAQLFANFKVWLETTNANAGNYRRDMRHLVINQRAFWNNRLNGNPVRTLAHYANEGGWIGTNYREIFGGGDAATGRINGHTNVIARKYVNTKLMDLTNTDENNQLLGAIIAANNGQELRTALVNHDAGNAARLNLNFANTQGWNIGNNDTSVIKQDDLPYIQECAVLTKLKFAFEANVPEDQAVQRKEDLLAFIACDSAANINDFFNTDAGQRLGLQVYHNKIRNDGDVARFAPWKTMAAAKALQLHLASLDNTVDNIAKLKRFAEVNLTVEFKAACDALGAPYNEDAFKNLFTDDNRSARHPLQQQVCRSVAAKVIEHYIAQSDDATHLAEVAGHVNFRDKVNALHAGLNIPLGNIPAGGGDAAIAFRRPLRVQAAKRFFEAGNFDWTQDNSAKLDLLHQLSELDLRDDPIQNGDKTAFKDALKNGGAQAGIFGMANSDEFNHADDGVVAKLLENDQDYRNMAAQAKQKLQALQQQLIQHIDANPYTPNELVAISAAGGNPALYNAIHNPHNLVGIDQANIIDVDVFRRPIQAHAVNKAVPSSIEGVTISNHGPDHRGKRQHLLTLAGTDTSTPDGKRRFREALRDLIPTAIENVDAMFADNEGLYAGIALQALEKVTMLAIEQRGIADDHVYQIARWKDDGDGELNEDVRNIRGYEWQEKLAEQIEKAHLSLDGTSLNKEQYKRALVRDGFRNKVQAHATQVHLQRLTNKNPTELNEKEWRILKQIAQCTSYDEFINEREDTQHSASRPYTQDPFVGGDVPAKQGDFAAKKALALKNSLLYLAQHSDNAQDLMALANAATNQPFFEKAVEILNLKDVDGEPAAWGDLIANIGDVGNLRAEIQAAIIPNLIKNQVLKTEDLTKLRAVAGANGRPEFRALLRDEYGFSDEAVNPPKLTDDECNNLINEAAFLYFQAKINQLPINHNSYDGVDQSYGLNQWISHAARNGDFRAVGGQANCNAILGLNQADPDNIDQRIMARLNFSADNDLARKRKEAIVNEATQKVVASAVRLQLDPGIAAHPQGLQHVIALQQALKNGQPLDGPLQLGQGDGLVNQHRRARYAVGGALSTPEARNELLKQVNTTLFEFAMLSANEARAANVAANDPGYAAKKCTQPFTGHRHLVDAFAALSLEEQNKMMAAVINGNQIAERYKPVFRQIVNSANPFHVKKHLNHLGFEAEHMAAQQPDGSSLYQQLAQDNKSLHHKIYNHKVAETLKNAGVQLTEQQIAQLNKIFYDAVNNGNLDDALGTPHNAKTADALLGNIPAIGGGNHAQLDTYRDLVDLIHTAIGGDDCGKTQDEMRVIFGIVNAHNQYTDAGRTLRNNIRASHERNTHLLQKLTVPTDAGNEQQGKEFIRFLLSQDTSANNWDHINNADVIEGLGRAFEQAKTYSEFKSMLKDKLPLNHEAWNHWASQKGPFQLPQNKNGRGGVHGYARVDTADLPALLKHDDPGFITAKQFARLKNQQISQNLVAGNDESLKTAVKLFKNSRKDSGGDYLKQVHDSSLRWYKPFTDGYIDQLKKIVQYRLDDTVFHVLPGYKNAADAPERKLYLEGQLELIEKLRYEHKDKLARYQDFIAACEEAGFGDKDEVKELIEKREEIKKRIKLLDDAVPKFEKGIANCERVIKNVIAAYAPTAARDTGRRYKVADLERIVAEKRGKTHSGSDDSMDGVGILEARAGNRSSYKFEVSNQEKEGQLADIDIVIAEEPDPDKPNEVKTTYASALAQGFSKTEVKNFGRSKVICAGAPAYDPDDPQPLYNYAFNSVRTQLDKMSVKPGKKVPAGTVYYWIENHSNPKVAAIYYAAAIAHGVNPKHIKVQNCRGFSPENAGIYKKSLFSIKLTETHKGYFSRVPNKEATLDASDSIRAVKGNKPKRSAGKEAQSTLQKMKSELQGVEDAYKKSNSGDLDDTLSSLDEGVNEDKDYSGQKLR